MKELKNLSISELEDPVQRDEAENLAQANKVLKHLVIKLAEKDLTEEKRRSLLSKTLVASQDSLAQLKKEQGEPSELWRFVRQGEKIIIFSSSTKEMHVDYAVANGLLDPDDAGYLSSIITSKDTVRIGREGSTSLYIRGSNPHRETTLLLLQNIAPEITFV